MGGRVRIQLRRCVPWGVEDMLADPIFSMEMVVGLVFDGIDGIDGRGFNERVQ